LAAWQHYNITQKTSQEWERVSYVKSTRCDSSILSTRIPMGMCASIAQLYKPAQPPRHSKPLAATGAQAGSRKSEEPEEKPQRRKNYQASPAASGNGGPRHAACSGQHLTRAERPTGQSGGARITPTHPLPRPVRWPWAIQARATGPPRARNGGERVGEVERLPPSMHDPRLARRRSRRAPNQPVPVRLTSQPRSKRGYRSPPIRSAWPRLKR
jgi:hypothetical protein